MRSADAEIVAAILPHGPCLGVDIELKHRQAEKERICLKVQVRQAKFPSWSSRVLDFHDLDHVNRRGKVVDQRGHDFRKMAKLFCRHRTKQTVVYEQPLRFNLSKPCFARLRQTQ